MTAGAICIRTSADDASLGALVKSLEFHAGKSQLVVCPGPWAARFLALVVGLLNGTSDADVIQAWVAPDTKRTRETDVDSHIPPCEAPEGQTLQQAVERATFRPSFIAEQDFRGASFTQHIDLVYFFHTKPAPLSTCDRQVVMLFDHEETQLPISSFTKAQTIEVVQRLWKITKKHFESHNAAEHAYLEFAKHHKADIRNLDPSALAKMFLLATPIRCEEFAPARCSGRPLRLR